MPVRNGFGTMDKYIHGRFCFVVELGLEARALYIPGKHSACLTSKHLEDESLSLVFVFPFFEIRGVYVCVCMGALSHLSSPDTSFVLSGPEYFYLRSGWRRSTVYWSWGGPGPQVFPVFLWEAGDSFTASLITGMLWQVQCPGILRPNS